MSMDVTLELRTQSRRLDYLICPLLGDMTTLARLKQVIFPPQSSLLSVEQDGVHEPVLDKHYPLYAAFAEHPDNLPG